MTPEGRIAADLALRPGLSVRAGERATIVGLDQAAALALAPLGHDHDRLCALLADAEQGLLQAARAAEQEPSTDG
jgi:hypothetical protein